MGPVRLDRRSRIAGREVSALPECRSAVSRCGRAETREQVKDRAEGGEMLKPKSCPFCGYGLSRRDDLDFYEGAFMMQCSHCGARGPRHVIPNEAISKWNTRPSAAGGNNAR